MMLSCFYQLPSRAHTIPTLMSANYLLDFLYLKYRSYIIFSFVILRHTKTGLSSIKSDFYSYNTN